MKSLKVDLGVLAAQLVFVVVFLGVWEWVAVNRIVDPIFIGRPTKIMEHLFNALFVERDLLKDTAWTMWATLIAFAMGSVAGVAFGLIFSVWSWCERFFNPLFTALNALPRIALAPLFILWFGLGTGSKVALGFSLTFFIVLSNTVAGARSVDQDWLVLSRMLGAKRAQIFWKVTLVSAVPTIFSGLRLGLIYALLGVVGSEIIASQNGLGQQLTYLAGTFNTNGVFAVLIFMSFLGILLTWIMDQVERYLLRWR
ncbi:ABC transporter permease [Bradyrhizobium sp. B097]|uniref:ABC transporter permease n=1 Tax=Bradyrhizobium sp. B097 TaxID=3140244 RepID=UPI0031844963